MGPAGPMSRTDSGRLPRLSWGSLGLGLLTLALLVAPLSGQESQGTRIVVSGTGSVEVDPDFATMAFGVQVVMGDARSAADSLSLVLDQVMATLEALGFPADSLTGRRFTVSPSRNALQGGRIEGYSATANVRLRTFELTRLPEIVQSVLDAGATDVNQVIFDSSRRSELREEALRLALQAAERDATVLAEARGGQLGELLEINTDPRSNSGIMLSRTNFASTSMLTPEMIRITANVGMTWLLAG